MLSAVSTALSKAIVDTVYWGLRLIHFLAASPPTVSTLLAAPGKRALFPVNLLLITAL